MSPFLPDEAPRPDAAPTAESSTSPSGRDHRGRFMRGNPGGPGNPFARRVAALRVALLRPVGEEQMAALADRLLTMALGGDLVAAKLVLSYCVGKPGPSVDPDSLDRHEWELCRKSSVSSEEMVVAMGVPLAFATTVVRESSPGVAQGLADQMLDGLAEQARLDAEEAEEEAALDAEEVEGKEDEDEEEAQPEAAPATPAPEAGWAVPQSLAAILAALGLGSLPLPGVPGAGSPTIPLAGPASEGAAARRTACPPAGRDYSSRHPTAANGGAGAAPDRHRTVANGVANGCPGPDPRGAGRHQTGANGGPVSGAG